MAATLWLRRLNAHRPRRQHKETLMSTSELRTAFCDLITKARRADLTPEQRRGLIDFLEREIQMIREPLHDDGDVWSDLGGARRAAR